jgi:hypothetical protein
MPSDSASHSFDSDWPQSARRSYRRWPKRAKYPASTSSNPIRRPILQPYGVDSQAMITVGDVEHRRDIKRIIVTCINDKYKSLDGEYLSIDDLKLRVKELEESKKNEH